MSKKENQKIISIDIMKKKKYKVYFYRLNGTKFIRICTRTPYSIVTFALKTAIKQKAYFIIKKLSK